jgi:hypothetical protein
MTTDSPGRDADMTRRTRLLAALALLAVVWPAFANALLATLGWVASHPVGLGTAAAVVLLAGTVPGPVDRALTRLFTNRPAPAPKASA